MNKFSIFFRRKKSKLKNWFRETFPQFASKKPHILRPVVTRGKSSKHMMSIIGRIVENLSFFALLLITIAVIISFALMYQNQVWLDSNGQTISLTFYECLYFSVVTFTSLGYGDMSPIGFSRVLACFEVISGLFLIAVLVGKIASERQTAWVQLIYTSINQKRLTKYRKSLSEKIKDVKEAVDIGDENQINSVVKTIFPFVSGIKNYLLFNSNQGDLAYFGNKSALRKLYLSLFELQTVLIQIYKKEKLSILSNQQIEKTLVKIYVIASHMKRFHGKHKRVLQMINKILNNHELYLNIYDIIQSQIGENVWNTRRMSDNLLDQVFRKLPAKPWKQGLHKEIARDLKISNSLCTSCINELTKRGQIS